MNLKDAISKFLEETSIKYEGYVAGDAAVKSAYMKQDATAPIKLAKIFLPQIAAAGLEESYKIEIENVAPTIEMNTRGIKIDVPNIVARLKSNLARAGELQAEIDSTGKLNLNSPQQLRRFIHNDLGLPIMPVDGAVTTDKKTLHPFLIAAVILPLKRYWNIRSWSLRLSFSRPFSSLSTKTRCAFIHTLTAWELKPVEARHHYQIFKI